MSKTILLFIFLLIPKGFWAQSKTYEGTIKDGISAENISYVNIGVVGRNNGTVSDVNGNFSITLDENIGAETLRISIVGYKSKEYSISGFKAEIQKNKVILLEKNVAELKEVIIKNKKLKCHLLGNALDKKTVSAGFVNNILGNEIGILIKVKKKPTYIEAFNATIDYNNYKELKFRLNFYDVKNGLPNNNILTENIIVKSTIKKGLLTVDLSGYNIMVEKDFIVTIELIEGLGEGGLHFDANSKGTPMITRAASQGKWIKQNDASFGFSVTARY